MVALNQNRSVLHRTSCTANCFQLLAQQQQLHTITLESLNQGHGLPCPLLSVEAHIQGLT